jgi:acyl-coenzyme A thioesterase 13
MEGKEASQQLGRARRFLESVVAERGGGADPNTALNFDTQALAGIRDFSLGPGECRCTLLVEQQLCNRYGTLHGGCQGGREPAAQAQRSCRYAPLSAARRPGRPAPLPHPWLPPAATLVDTIGTAALVTLTDLSGVSLSISVHYLSPMPGGEDVEITARVLKLGGTIATIGVELRRAGGGELVATGTHVKFLTRHSALPRSKL